MISFLYVGLGGFLGACARYGAGLAVSAWGVPGHWGTFGVNALGCFIIGFAAPCFSSSVHPGRLFLVAGFLGGFTTFSTFSLETLHLAQRQEFSAAVWNVCISVAVCLAAVWAGGKLQHLFR